MIYLNCISPTIYIFLLYIIGIQSNKNPQCIHNYKINKCSITIDICPQYQQNQFIQCIQFQTKTHNQLKTNEISIIYDQTQCLLKCCGISYTNFTQSQIKRCKQSTVVGNQQKQQNNIFFILFSLFFLIIAALCTWLCQQKCKKPFDNYLAYICRKYSNNHKSDQSSSSQSGYKMYTDDQQRNDQHRQNIQLSLHKITQNLSMICPVCLSSRTNSLAKCGHYFHFQCIIQWYFGNKVCPVCKQNNVSKLKTYCSHCFNKFIQIDLKDYQSKQMLMSQFHDIKCQDCRKI